MKAIELYIDEKYKEVRTGIYRISDRYVTSVSFIQEPELMVTGTINFIYTWGLII